MPSASSSPKKRPGLPIPATACTFDPVNADGGAVMLGSRTRTKPIGDERHAVRAGSRRRRGCRAGRELDDCVDLRQPRRRLAQRARGQQPAVAETARRVDDGDLDVARQP